MLTAVKVNEIIGVNRLEHRQTRTTYRRDWEHYALTIKKTGRTVYAAGAGKNMCRIKTTCSFCGKACPALSTRGWANV
jgi:hypothetical protein